jgi:hypothetical protein
MKKLRMSTALFTVCVLGLVAQEQSRIRPIGTVTSIDAASGHIMIKTDAGPQMIVLVQDDTTFLEIAPGEKDLKNAARITLADISAGDRILTRGHVTDDQKSVLATSVIVMSKADIAKKRAADRAEWEKRGVGGIITALDAGSKQITISVHTLAGSQPLIIRLADEAVLRRYAPDSVKFSDAKPSRFEELKVGDQVRALGNKSEDGTHYIAEELISGSFENIAATVEAVNPGENTVQVTDLITKKKLLVRVNADSTLRRLPPFAAQMLAMRVAAGAPPGGGAMSGASGRPGGGERALWAEGGAAAGSVGPDGMVRREGPRDLQSMIERMPAMALAELKPGESIIIASTKGADPDKVTAITLLAGVGPILTAASQGGRPMTVGSWNLDMNMNIGF